MGQRVAVFIDYQNVYKRARAAFAPDPAGGGHVHGQVRPIAVGLTLRGNSSRELKSVNVYRGLPSSKHDPKGYSAAQRQISAWSSTGGGLVTCCTRPINYRDPQQPREKGIDVQLAIDVVLGAIRNEYDVAVVFSDDTDLNPALEAVGSILGPGHAELATWQDLGRGPRVVQSGGMPAYVHVLNETVYRRVQDLQDYNMATARKPRPPRRP